jgi:thiazolylpeptide-type bacteriocin precursor
MADEITPENESEQVEEVEVLDEADGTAVPEAGASSGWLCCSSSSSSSCCSAS